MEHLEIHGQYFDETHKVKGARWCGAFKITDFDKQLRKTKPTPVSHFYC